MDSQTFYKEIAGAVSQKSPPFQQQVLKNLLDLLPRHVSGDGGGRSVLDLGTGLGANLTLLSKRFSKVFAGDISVEAVVRSSGECRFDDVAFVALNALDLPFAAEVLDVVVCTEVLEHVTDLPGAAQEIYRVLRPGGYAIISTASYSNPVGLWKRFKDKRAGRHFWDPWGAHKGGFEHLMTPGILESALARFTIIESRGAGFILAWFFGTPIARYHHRFPLLAWGRLPLIKKLAMHYYILAMKGGEGEEN